MATIPNGMTRDQVTIAFAQLDPANAYRFTSETDYEWRGPGAQPSDAAIQSAWNTYNTAQQNAAAATSAAEAQDATDRATLDAFDTAMANYIALATPTAAQTANAVQAQARAWRYVVRRLRRLGIL